MVIPRRHARDPDGITTFRTDRDGTVEVSLDAQASWSAPTRMVFLLHGEDPFRTRLRVGELVESLLAAAGANQAISRRGDLPSSAARSA